VQALEQLIADALGTAFRLSRLMPTSGGSINTAYCLEGNTGTAPITLFAKCNRLDLLDMFIAEAEGLKELRKAEAISVPEPVCYGEADGHAWLVTEYIRFGSRKKDSMTSLGMQLADLHYYKAGQFGWFRNNTIGSTAQVNSWSDNWIEFYRDCRLLYQLRLAAGKGLTGSLQNKGERLLADLDVFFFSYSPVPSLLHGDLWGGNCSFDETGQPVIFDPAVYYGDREADIAMTELFGGFSSGFYDSYNEAWPLDDGYRVRKQLYNLYHILNHANLFGGSYAFQAESMMEQLLAEI
jgi:fructosamine-3-kinase